MTVCGPLVLDGCRTQPLASYLKSLGVLRLLAAQADPGVRGFWQDDRLVLLTTLNADELVAFFIQDYQPSPVVSPWNHNSGFYPNDNQNGIAPIESSLDPRLEGYRRAIETGRALVADAGSEGIKKSELLARCRARLPDQAIAWMDAAVVLLDDPAYPPLLGTGGNDGHLDFSNNFMQRLLPLLGIGKIPKGSSPAGWFRSALFGEPAAGVKAAVGQFDPGGAGGPNSATLGAGESTVNPADFVLLVEGSLLIAAGAARRLGSPSKRAAMPFTFDASPVGYSSAAADEDGHGELWLPLWSSPASVPELGRLFAEARCDWRGGQARSGLDAARAAVTLGVDRGIDRFTRYALVTRNGQSTAAVPVGTIAVADRDDVRVLAALDGWLDRVRRAKNRPHAVGSALRSVENAMFTATTREAPELILDVLSAAARLDAVVATATAFHANVPPLDLDGRPWMSVLEGAAKGPVGPEVRLAACFASLMDRAPGPLGSLRQLLRPVRLDGRHLAWTDTPIVPGLGQRPVLEVLAAVQTRRFMAIDQLPSPPSGGGSEWGAARALFGRGLWARPDDIRSLLHQEIDLDGFERLLAALLLLNWADCHMTLRPPRLSDDDSMPILFSLLAPFFGSPPIFSEGPPGPPGAELLGDRSPTGRGLQLLPEPSWPAVLGRQTQEALGTVVEAALRRLRIARWNPVVTRAGLLAGTPAGGEPVPDRASHGTALAAALLLRLNPGDRWRLLGRVAVKPPEPA